MSSRAHLLAGLRTGGPRAGSPFEGDIPQQHSFEEQAILKPNATPFTPSQTAPLDPSHELESQFASLRMQQAIASHDAPRMYGALQGQPAPIFQGQTQQELENALRLKQAHLLLEQRVQLEMLRMQQQQLFHNHMHADYDRAYDEYGQDANLRSRNMHQAYPQSFPRQQAEYDFAQLRNMRQTHPTEQLDPTLLSLPHARHIPRSNSPSQLQGRRERQPSNSAADTATSWRSNSSSLGKSRGTTVATGNGLPARPPPSIVVDDSSSEKSESGQTAESHTSDRVVTPQTSEEDVCQSEKKGMEPLTVGKRHVDNELSAQGEASGAKKAFDGEALSIPKRLSASLLPTPRAVSVGAAPRSRAFSQELKLSNSSAGQVSRQPRGPPTEFKQVNFSSRLSARTRREAMSRLCASPRAASFTLGVRAAA